MKSIIYSAPMVLAILAGQKDMTRRPMKPQPFMERGLWRWKPKKGVDINMTDNADLAAMFAPYKVGEVVYLKETYWAQGGDIYYKADWLDGNPVNFDCDVGKWKSGLFMPEWASRIHLKIISVRAEQLQNITEEDAFREGCGPSDTLAYRMQAYPSWNAKLRYAELWDVLYGPDSWATNPFVWVYAMQNWLSKIPFEEYRG